MIEDGKKSFFERESINETFPEIDFDNFFFVYPNEYQGRIPDEVEYKIVEESKGKCKPIESGIIVDGASYAKYLANRSGYAKFEIKVKAIRYISAVLVSIRILIPVLTTIYNSITCLINHHNGEDVDESCNELVENIPEAILYFFQ